MRIFNSSFKISCTAPLATFLIADKLKIVDSVFDTTGLALTDILVDGDSVWLSGKNCPSDNAFHIFELIGSGVINYIGVDDPNSPTQWYNGALKWFSFDDVVTTLDQRKTTFQLPDNGVVGNTILTDGTGEMSNSTEWQLSNSVISVGEMHFDANDDYSKLLDTIYDTLMPTGKIFQIQLEVTEYTKGVYAQLQVKDGDSISNYMYFDSLGIQTVVVQLINPNIIFRLATNGGSCSMDNLLIQPWTNAVAFKNITTDAYVGEIPPINPPVEPPVGGLKYPLVAKLIMSNKEYQDPVLQAAIAKHDLIEIGFYRDWNKTMNIAQAVDEIHTRGLTNKNGKVMLFQYTNVMEMQAHTPGEAKYDIYLEVNTKNYWLRNAVTGGKLLDGYSWEINMGSDMQPNWEYQTWLANRHRNVLFTDENNFDGWYVDNAFRRTRQDGEPADWNVDGSNETPAWEEDSYGSDKFREGTAAFVAKIRDLGLNIPVMANYDRGPDYPHYRNLTEGGLLEWADKHVDSMGWEFFMKEQYYASMELTLPPHYVIWDAMHYATDTDYKEMRYGLCSVLMHNGYYCSSANDSYSTIFWFDEYDLDIGEPVDTPPVPDGTIVNVREFTKGYVVVNPTSSAKNVTIPAGYKRFDATDYDSQDASHNNGQSFSGVQSIPAKDGYVLVLDI